MTRKRPTLTVQLSNDLAQALNDIAARHSTSVTDELRNAIQDRAFLVDKVDDGYGVVVEKPGSQGVSRTFIDLL